MAAPYRPPIAIRNRPNALNKIHTRGVLYDFLNYITEDTVKWEDDFLGDSTTAVSTINAAYVIGGSGASAPYVANTTNGAIAPVATSNSTSVYLGNQNWLADQNCTLKVRFNISAITTVKIEAGFVSTNATATLGATANGLVLSLAATPTVNTASADGTVVIMDTASGLANPTFWRMVGSVAGTTKLFTPTLGQIAALQAPVANTYQTITLQLRRVAIASEDVDAEFWVNGVSMGVMRGGACTFNTKMYPFVVVNSASATRTLTVDYFNVYQQRDMTN